MKNAIKAQLLIFSRTRFLLGVLAMGVAVILSSVDLLIRAFGEVNLLSSGYHLNVILLALNSETVLSSVPILAVLPLSAGFIEATKNRFARYILIRTNYTTYLVSSIITCFCCGGGIIVLGVLLAEHALALLFLLKEGMEGDVSNTISVLLNNYVLLSLNGGFWAVVGMTTSTFMESKYIAYASPFIIYYLLIILCERYFPNAYLLYPPNWVNPDIWPCGVWGAATVLVELAVVVSILFVIRAGRRLREL